MEGLELKKYVALIFLFTILIHGMLPISTGAIHPVLVMEHSMDVADHSVSKTDFQPDNSLFILSAFIWSSILISIVLTSNGTASTEIRERKLIPKMCQSNYLITLLSLKG